MGISTLDLQEGACQYVTLPLPHGPPTYVSEMRCLLECSASLLRAHIPIDVLKPCVDIGIIMPDHLEIASEQSMISDIESDDRCVKSNIGFGQVLAKDEWPFTLS